MPVDDIKLSCQLDNYYRWKEDNKKKIKRPYCRVFEDNGNVKTEEDEGSYEQLAEEKYRWREDKNGRYRYCTIIHYTGFQSYRIEVRETIKEFYSTGKRVISYHLILSGSFKSNKGKGINWGRFTYQDLQEQIALIESIGLDASVVKIDNIAPSISLKLPFPVLEFLVDCLISYRGEQFKQYDPDSNGKVVGYYCPLHQVEIKIYDKSLQLEKPGHIMQFEKRFSKMQKLSTNFGLKYLSDLKDFEKVSKLDELLLSTWADILLFDNGISVADPRLNDRQREMIKYGDNYKYWKKLRTNTTQSTYKNRVREFKNLSLEFEGNNHHVLISNLIKDEWDYLMKICPKLPGANSRTKSKNLPKVTSKVRGKYGQVDAFITSTSKKINMEEKLTKRSKKTELNNSKSKKQIAKEKREQSSKLTASFFNALSVTLNKLNNQAA